MIRSKKIRNRLRDIEQFLLDEYKKSKEEKKRDWRTYEQRLMHRIKHAIRNLEPLIDEAVENIKVHKANGRKPCLSLKQKVTLLLLKQLFGKSNRMMSSMLAVFSLLSKIDVSYKTLERLYSDPKVEIALHNLHILILKRKGVKKACASGDGTGYSLTVKKHYASEASKRKNKAKKNKRGKKRAFVYSFNMMDLGTKMYIAYGTSFKSEKEAFNKSFEMLGKTKIKLDSIRLDKYYSYPSCIDKFGNTKVYVIPKKNATMKGSLKWKKTMKEFVQNTTAYLEEYYKRNNSESGFSADKRRLGWKINQRRPDRVNTAITCGALWHNLFNLYTT